MPLPSVASLAELVPGLARRSPSTALLETLGPPGASVLVWEPAATFRADPDTVRIWADRHVKLPPAPTCPSDLPAYLGRVVDRFGEPPGSPASSGLPFAGGLVGFVGYEWSASQEGPDGRRLDPFPDLWFGLFDRAVVGLPGRAPELVVAPSVRGVSLPAVHKSLASAVDAPAAPPKAFGPGRGISSSWGRAEFEAGVREVRRRIRRGDLYQANLAVRRQARGVDPWQLYRGLRERNPSPFAGYLQGDGMVMASASPERLLRVRQDGSGRLAETRPIAGTRPRGRGDADRSFERALRRSPKERAEHTMLVDLSRNDLGRVCELGTVEVDEWLTVERYSHVMHLVSNVRGRLPPETGVPELFRALMPGGSVTGTPKIRATEVIAELEPVPRGPFTGSLGYISLDGGMDFNLLIRSAFFPRGAGDAWIYAGAGIVQDSRPDREWAEVRAKAAVLLEAARGVRSHGVPWSPPRRYASWRPPAPPHQHASRDVLLIDNYDSFTYNLAQYLSMLGARVRVVRNDAESLATLRARAPTHVVLSPGPGAPSESGVTVDAVRAFEGTPLLGVCLGHEAIVEAYGGSLGIARSPWHGKASTMVCVEGARPDGLLADLAPTFEAARYHSLVAKTVPAQLRVTARSADGEVMAVEHRELPTFGVQFHPESLRTERGMAILDRFLEEGPARA